MSETSTLSAANTDGSFLLFCTAALIDFGLRTNVFSLSTSLLSAKEWKYPAGLSVWPTLCISQQWCYAALFPPYCSVLMWGRFLISAPLRPVRGSSSSPPGSVRFIWLITCLWRKNTHKQQISRGYATHKEQKLWWYYCSIWGLSWA